MTDAKFDFHLEDLTITIPGDEFKWILVQLKDEMTHLECCRRVMLKLRDRLIDSGGSITDGEEKFIEDLADHRLRYLYRLDLFQEMDAYFHENLVIDWRVTQISAYQPKSDVEEEYGPERFYGLLRDMRSLQQRMADEVFARTPFQDSDATYTE